MKTKWSKDESEELDNQLLNHKFSYNDVFAERYNEVKIVARHYCRAENAIAVLSNMPFDVSFICYGHLGAKLGIGEGMEEVSTIWEDELLEHIHPDDVAEKIAWELQFHSFVSQQVAERKSDYYLQHFLRIRDAEGCYHTVRHRIFYLDFDMVGNMRLALCLYTAVGQNVGKTGIIHSLDDTLLGNSALCVCERLLSRREREILRQISRGKPSKQIADELNISINTVNNHRQNIIRKLNCKNTAEAIVVAGKLQILGAK